MKTWTGAIGVFLLLACAGRSPAAEWYVATNGNDSADGTTWPTAKQTIQAAIDAAASNDTVWVSNGVYATGGRILPGLLPTNRVVIDKAIAVRSVNGPEETTIQGSGPLGDAAVRCAYVGAHALLAGFTLTGGATLRTFNHPDACGGGAWCEPSGILSYCRLVDNEAFDKGGGAYRGMLDHCAVIGNETGWIGGGTDGSSLTDCVVISNYVVQAAAGCGGGTLVRCQVAYNSGLFNYGGGMSGCTAYDCTIVGNSADYGGGALASTLYNCTVVSNFGKRGGGCMESTAYNSIVYGNTASVSGQNYSAGSFVYSCTTPDPGGTGNVTSDPQFVDAAAGNYRLAADSPCINAGDNASVASAEDLDGAVRIIFGTVDMGAYEFYYQHVATNGSDGASGLNWTEAKQTIQAAVDATTNGCVVLVSNGVYDAGGRAVDGTVTNRAAIDRPIEVRSVNGPEATIIQGSGTNGRIRCAYVGSNAVLSGFTLTNGAAYEGGTNRIGGGGALIAGGTVDQCVMVGNHALEGAGAYIAGDGLLNHCRVVGNSAGDTGGGGGVFGNSGGQLNNCLIAGNYAEWAPGVYGKDGGMELNNCTISGNSSFGGPAVVAPTSTLRNCIVYSNNVDTNHVEIGGDPIVVHSCSPGLSGDGNVADDPQFVDAAAGDYRLQSTSPCMDAGDDGAVQWAEDLDGNQRSVYGAVDMGAYETQLTGTGTWYGAITNGLTGDLDCVAGDGVPNLLKYATGGSPRISDDHMLLGWRLGGAGPTMTFNRNPNATDVQFVVEGKDQLTNGAAWRGIATNVGGSWLGATNVEEAGTGNPVVCTVTDPVALRTNRFLRLRVTRP